NELHNSNPGTTRGERLYRTQGITGIRGEAEAGFPSVIHIGLPYLRKSRGDWNTRLINTLLHLMTIVEDSNVLGRHNRQILNTIQRQIKEVLNKGGSSDDRGMEILNQIDLNFIEQNISPGGSADLLAVTIFLYNIEVFIQKRPL
ncbi:MAG: triphosphoribosyl-dephospho-CoA synthase, partial [Spirochaetaceae bacterium]|nr:triphosphoribosyl-dephospho-CoA synthase [Spirochaetaceae bacterium]